MKRWAPAPEQRHQMVLFPERLDEVLPPNHSVRLLDELLRQLDWSAFEATYHSRLGQPAIHPRVLASVLLYGLLTRIRSSRGLEEALLVRLDFRWLAQGQTLDHSTLSNFRRQHGVELQQLFGQVVQIARQMGLVLFKQLGYDATRMRAHNRRSGTRTPAELQQERDELAARFQELEQQAATEDAREEELFGPESRHELPPELRDPRQRLDKLNAVLQELERLKEAGGKVPKRVPTTDLDARVMPNKDGGCAELHAHGDRRYRQRPDRGGRCSEPGQRRQSTAADHRSGATAVRSDHAAGHVDRRPQWHRRESGGLRRAWHLDLFALSGPRSRDQSGAASRSHAAGAGVGVGPLADA